MDQGKQQVFPYSMRTVALSTSAAGGNYGCDYRYFLQVTPPTNALTIENLFTHFVFQSSVSVPSNSQNLISIGIVDSIPAYGQSAPYERLVTINQVADSNRRVDLSIDLSPLLKKSLPSCYIQVTVGLIGISGGAIEVWKADALYTTTGIR